MTCPERRSIKPDASRLICGSANSLAIFALMGLRPIRPIAPTGWPVLLAGRDRRVEVLEDGEALLEGVAAF